MEGRVRRITRQRVSHFILGEEGKVGSRSAFVAATVVGATSLATMLLGVAQNAQAASCGPIIQCAPREYCCYCSDPGQGNCGAVGYGCSGTDQSAPGISCWYIGP
ncbi:hypothetical protein GF312_07425 [Candidatus Poribacteria bacterium]|nr:hypothetical protein [Candidatus Poribacteria bacterium]